MSKEYELTSETMCLNGKKLFFVPRECAVLCVWDIDEDSCRIVSRIGDEDGLCERLFNGMCCTGDKLVLTPYNGRNIWVFDTNEEKLHAIGLNSICDPSGKAKFVGCRAYGDRVYMFGYNEGGIISIDPGDDSICKVLIKDDGETEFWGQSTGLHNGFIYVSDLERPGICRIDPKENTAGFIGLRNDNIANCGTDCSKNELFAAPQRGNELFVMDLENNGVTPIVLPDEYKNDKNLFNGIAVSEECIVLYSTIGKTIVLDRHDHHVIKTVDGCVRYVFYEEGIGFIMSRTGVLERYDEQMQLLKRVDNKIDKDAFIDILSANEMGGNVYYETPYFGLEEMIGILCSEKDG